MFGFRLESGKEKAELFALARRRNKYRGKFTKKFLNMQMVVQNATARTSPVAEVRNTQTINN
jgi:hypothetical protein